MKYRILFIVGIIIVIFTLLAVKSYNYYAPASLLSVYKTPPRLDDTLRIAYIGDSWAFYHINHTCKIPAIIETNIKKPVRVISKGICGAKSKKIYQMMFSENGETFKDVLMESPQFCVVMAGVNDTYAKTGSEAYAHNMELIIRFLLANDVTPVIVAIPNYDVEGAYKRQTTLKKLLRHLSMAITKSDINCLNAYRSALEYRLKKAGLDKRIIYIKGTDWNDNYKQYQSDCLHLNDNGYLKLDICIAQYIISSIHYSHPTKR